MVTEGINLAGEINRLDKRVSYIEFNSIIPYYDKKSNNYRDVYGFIGDFYSFTWVK